MSKEDDIRLDQKVRAAWMYYIAGQNQSEIASQLGTSRPVVQRLIAAAKEEGIVSINLHHPVANCLDYAQLLQEKYRLIECNVVPAFSEESTLDSVSFGCYQLMARYLQDDKEKIIGLGSGLTLKKALQRIDFDSLNTRCVALISAMNADGQCNYYDDVPLLLTRKIKAKYYQWPAPRYAQSAEEHEMWCTNRLFRSVSGVAQEADVIFVGIGPLGTQSPIFKDGFINQAQMDELTARGGIGAEDVGTGQVKRLDHRCARNRRSLHCRRACARFDVTDRRSATTRRQNSSPCGDDARGGTKRVRSNGGCRRPSNPYRFNASAKRRASRSAYTPSPRSRCPKRLS